MRQLIRHNNSGNPSKHRPLIGAGILTAIIGTLVGTNFVLAKFTVIQGAAPLAAYFWQLLLATLILLIAAVSTGKRLSLRRRYIAYYLFGGIVGGVAPNLLAFFVLQRIPAGLFTVLITLSPLFTFIIASAVERKLLPVRRLVGVLLGFTGVSLATISNVAIGGVESAWGMIAILTPFLLAANNVFRNKAYPVGADALSLALGMLLVQLAVLWPVVALAGYTYSPLALASAVDVAVLAMGILSAVSYVLTLKLQKLTDGLGSSQIGYFVTLTGVIVGAIFLGETIGILIIAAVGLAFVGVALTNGHLDFTDISRRTKLLSKKGVLTMKKYTHALVSRVRARTNLRLVTSVIVMLMMILTLPAFVQAAEVGVSPWGNADQLGRLNLMTPASRQEVLARIDGSKTYDLSVDYFIGMPSWQAAGDPHYQIWMTHTPHGTVVDDPLRVGRDMNEYVSYTGSAVSMYTHMGTHIDALSHFGLNGKIWNGFKASEHLGDRGWKVAGAETIPPIIARGILIDIAALKGVDMLDAGYRISRDDLVAALQRQGTNVHRGDVVLIRTGRMQVLENAEAFMANPPGLGMAAARYLVEEKGVMLLGADNLSLEAFPSEVEGDYVPVHTYLLGQHGVPIIELAYLEDLAKDGLYEFAFIGGSLKLRGADAAPIRPIAIPFRRDTTIVNDS